MCRSLRGLFLVVAAVVSIGAAQAPGAGGTFPSATTETLPNGVVVASQGSAETPIVSVSVFLPAGAAQQPLDRAGIAGLTAAVILGSRVDRDKSLSQVASDDG